MQSLSQESGLYKGGRKLHTPHSAALMAQARVLKLVMCQLLRLDSVLTVVQKGWWHRPVPSTLAGEKLPIEVNLNAHIGIRVLKMQYWQSSPI